MVDVTSDGGAAGQALRKDCRLVLVGDPDQLPSVGPGNLFADLIRSGTVPTVRLTQIFRQAAQSAIVRNAHLVNCGGDARPAEATITTSFSSPAGTAQSAAETIVDLCRRRLPGADGHPGGPDPGALPHQEARGRAPPP